MDAETQFSIIIPTWNRCHSLGRTLKNLLRQKKAVFEIIVVDNGSTDGSRAVCEKIGQSDGRIRCLSLPENKGVPYAVNQGIGASRGQIIACIDDDELSHDEYLLEKVGALAKEQPWGLLNINQRNHADGTLIADQLFAYHRQADGRRNFYVHNFANGAVFIKREVIEKIGLFEAGYFRQSQENEYALRAILAGFLVLHCPRLRLQHISDPFRLDSAMVCHYSLRNAMLMNHKYFSGWRLLAMNGWQLAHYLAKTALGRLSLRLFFQAWRDYRKKKGETARCLNYNPQNMRRYFFVARKVAYAPEEIAGMSFAAYFLSGLRRFLN